MFDFGNSIGVQLFRKVFGGYIIVALLLTAYHIYSEYEFAKELVVKDLLNKEDSFKKALSNSVWHFDEDQINANAVAITKDDSIVGVSIISANSEVFSQKGVVAESERKYKEYIFNKEENLQFQSELISYSFKLQDNKLAPNEVLGSVTLYSSTNVVLGVAQSSITIIIISAIIKTIALWAIFLYLSNKLLTKPLEKITRATKDFNIENPTSIDIHIDNNIQYELLTLSRAFNRMSTRIVMAFKEEATAKEEIKKQSEIIHEVNDKLKRFNNQLKDLVADEVAKNREKDKMLLAQSKQAAMGEMISMIAHQWRQPLTSIGMTLDNIALDVELGDFEEESLVEQIDKTNNQLKFLSKTIDDFRNFFKEDKSKESVLVSTIIDDSLELTSNHLKSKGITVSKEYGDKHNVEVYRNELMQVFLNLINNSKDAIVDNEISNGEIAIKTHEEEKTIIIEIEDNAGGIPEDILEKIFEPYFSTKKEKNGTGLGLFMSKNIIEDHNSGKLSARNSSKGAVFTITINK